MLLYLSSYKIGNRTDILKKWIKENNNKIVFIANARDWKPETPEKEMKIIEYVNELESIGFEVIKIDLRNYFDNKEKLKQDLDKYNAFYITGGNVFNLRMAMKFSCFDLYIKERAKSKEKLLYSGFSAGVCVLAPRLNGLEIVDEPLNPYNNEQVIYDGLGIIDYTILPHYKSDHIESELIDKSVEYFETNKIKYKTLRDGEVCVEIVSINN